MESLKRQLKRRNIEFEDLTHRTGLKDRLKTELSALVDFHGLHRQSFDTVAEKVAGHRNNIARR